MCLTKKYAQNTIEYVMVITIVITALILMQNLFTHFIRGRSQVIEDYVAEREE